MEGPLSQFVKSRGLEVNPGSLHFPWRKSSLTLFCRWALLSPSVDLPCPPPTEPSSAPSSAVAAERQELRGETRDLRRRLETLEVAGSP